MSYTDIPWELKHTKQWVCTNQSKAPINPLNGSYAKLNDPSTWGTFQDAVEAVEDNEEITHIGFVFTENDPFVGIDLDHISENTEFADEIADYLDSYTEVSMSGDGLHIICYGSIPVNAMKTKFEIKYSNSYFILTGNLYKDFDSIIEHREAKVMELYEKYKKVSNVDRITSHTGKSCHSSEINHRLAEALSDVAFRSYYIGERPSEDESSNDMGFMSKIVEWFGRDQETCWSVLIDSPYFRQKDNAHQSKILSRDDYRQMTYDSCASTIEYTRYERPQVKIIVGDQEKESPYDLNNPSEWVQIETNEDGEIKKVSIDEPAFVEWFRSTQIVSINERYYSMSGEIPDSYVEHTIHECIKPFIKTGLDSKVRSLSSSFKREVYMEPPPPAEYKLFFQNVNLQVHKDGTFTEIANEFTLQRLNVEYQPDAECPLWHKVLDELLTEDEQYTLQEFLGYCLLPTTKAQYAMFLIGNGGEGKSIVNSVMGSIMGNLAVHGKLEDIDGNKFFTSELENRLMLIADDLPTRKLPATSMIKNIITSTAPLRVESKGVRGYQIKPFVRIFGTGNDYVQCYDDVSDGFYRRMIQIKVKPKTRTKDDKLILDKLLKEKSGILNWLLEGLSRVVSHNFDIYLSESCLAQKESIKKDAVSVLSYLEDSGRVEFNKMYNVTSKDFYDDYVRWCESEGIRPMTMTTVGRFMSNNCSDLGIKAVRFYDENKARKRGYAGIKFTSEPSLTRKKNFKLKHTIAGGLKE